MCSISMNDSVLYSIYASTSVWSLKLLTNGTIILNYCRRMRCLLLFEQNRINPFIWKYIPFNGSMHYKPWQIFTDIGCIKKEGDVCNTSKHIYIYTGKNNSANYTEGVFQNSDRASKYWPHSLIIIKVHHQYPIIYILKKGLKRKMAICNRSSVTKLLQLCNSWLKVTIKKVIIYF